jgi:hypothetical protein
MRTRIFLLIEVSESPTTGLQTLQGSILSLHVYIVSVLGPQLTVEALELLIFNADPVPDLDPDPAFILMRIRIRN